MSSKVCSKCKVEKPVSEFHARRDRPGGRVSECKVCKSIRENDSPPKNLETFAPFGTPIEQSLASEVIARGSIVAAAEAIGMAPAVAKAHLRELAARAARRGWSPDHDMTKATPDGFSIKGVSTMYDADGNIRAQWVKTRADEAHKLEAIAAAVATIAEPFRGLAEPAPVAELFDGDLMAVYIMGDPHVGMFSWAHETGADFDLQIAERDLVTATDHLVDLAPAAAVALILNLGDFYHADNSTNRTSRSGAALDVDTRYPKVLAVGVRIMRRVIDRALLKHDRVRVVIEIGNHDDNSSLMLALCLQSYYEREPRVEIDTSPAKFHWYRFGKCLIGVTHGDTVKASALPGVMAVDRASDWGETEHRVWYTGHVHHDSAKDFPGCTVETFRTLAPADAWHRAAGYRSAQDMKVDVWHREYGRVNRHIVGIRQIRARQDAERKRNG